MTSDLLLNQIFDLTQSLYQEMSDDRTDTFGNHTRIFRLLTDLGVVLADCDRASFWKWDKRHHTLWTTAAVGEDRITIPEDTGLVGLALREGKTQITNDPYNSPYFNKEVDQQTGYTTKSILCMPITDCRGDLIGVFQAINKNNGEFNDTEDTRRLSMVAFICGITLESQTFLDDSQHDKLTGLKNRMGFYADYASIFSKKDELSMFICDIDFFKKVNDTYGHNAGDAVLAQTAHVFEENIREIDSVYRWGGEEFIVFVPNAKVEEAVKVAERVRTAIMNTPCEFEGTTIRYTMSMGVTYVDPELTIEENIAAADQNLYTAKESGRNRVIF